MADTKADRTHKHRNIIDDVLDFGLAVAGAVWYFFFDDVEIDAHTMAMVATAGATARASLRRILMKLWGHHVDAIEARGGDDVASEADAPADDTADEVEPEPSGDSDAA